jgi:tRNA N6-adenosine threonylcarbamoyltransferase
MNNTNFVLLMSFCLFSTNLCFGPSKIRIITLPRGIYRFESSALASFSTNLEEPLPPSTSQSDSSVDRKANKELRYEKARKKRHSFIGMAKAVDRGQYSVTYNPGFPQFSAKSGLPDRSKPFLVLGIESSCDDTGAAVVRSDGVILGEALKSQQEIHEPWGGVVPSLAKVAHEENLQLVIDEALRRANLSSIQEVDAIGVTVGPGLEVCLRVGCRKAQELAQLYQKPFIGVHHLEAHILMARMGSGVTIPATDETHATDRTMHFPFLALLISGGHCQLMKCFGIGNYSILGGTIDDSLGATRYPLPYT